MTIQAVGARHIKTLWKEPGRPWNNVTLQSGILQPNRVQGFRRWSRWGWWLKAGPLFVERDNSTVVVGLTAGRRIVFVRRHA